ncbi:MAG: VWA domain-containing protein [Terriglobales bacterium]
MRVSLPLTLIFILCFCCLSAAQVTSGRCAWLPTDIPHAGALRGVCEYSISVPMKMPNFVCEEAASRYAGSRRALTDLISASVRYEDGNESYSDVKVNGKPVSTEIAQSTGLWSTGEFGSNNLRSIFDRENQARFEFARASTLGEHSAWVFTYQIAQQHLPLWRLHVGSQVVAPPYQGEVWVDQKTGEVLRFRSIAENIQAGFPLTGAELEIDYESVAFSDGSSFLLPTDITATAKDPHGESGRNVVRLRNCHKFGAKARIVANADIAPLGADSAAQVAPTLDSLQKDLAENQAIFAAIGEQAFQENTARLKAEQEQMQQQMADAATASALARLSALRSEQLKIQAEQQPATNSAPALSDLRGLPTLKVNVNLVPVSVVLRDAQGHAVGNFVKDNFRLFDEGKPQVITRFSVESAVLGVSRAGGDTTAPLHAEGTVQPITNQVRPAAPERDTAYLFDDVHSTLAELASARDAAARHLGSLRPEERAAVFTISGTVVVDFTDDREQLLAGVRNLRPHPIIPENDCPPISHYMADLMLNQHDPDARGIAVQEVEDCALRSLGFSSPQAGRIAAAKAIEVLDAGNAESKNALAVLNGVIRRTASMPGQRTIVLVSPGFLALTPETHEDVMKIVDGAVRSGIIINTLDAGGLVAAGFTGSATDLEGSQFHSAEAEARRGVMLDFASGTGGIFFHNNNNLDEGFRRTADVPEFVYVLGFSPQKLDGRFHRLKVTLNSAARFELQTRRGYYAVKPTSAD